MSFKEVKPLINKDTNTPSCLCPVAALRSYLQHTGNKQSGKLFLSPSNHDKILTVQQLGSHIRSLIKTADPSSKVKTHDIRKLAASHSFVETMVIGDLVSNFNWSSPAVFYKHYFTQAETLSRPVSLPTQPTLLGLPFLLSTAGYLRYPLTGLVATNTLLSPIG